MTVTLAILPIIDDESSEHSDYATSLLYVPDVEKRLYDKIKALPLHRLTKELFSHLGRDPAGNWDENCFSKTESDSYGNEIKFVYASDLRETDLPKPVRAYIMALDEDVKLALHWS